MVVLVGMVVRWLEFGFELRPQGADSAKSLFMGLRVSRRIERHLIERNASRR